MKHLYNQEIHDILIKLRGVGPWTVQNFLMFGLGRHNLFPMADIGLQNALKKRLRFSPETKQSGDGTIYKRMGTILELCFAIFMEKH